MKRINDSPRSWAQLHLSFIHTIDMNFFKKLNEEYVIEEIRTLREGKYKCYIQNLINLYEKNKRRRFTILMFRQVTSIQNAQ